MSLKSSDYKKTQICESEVPEISCATVLTEKRQSFISFEMISSWHKTVRIAAYALRFINKCRKLHNCEGALSVDELTFVENRIGENAQLISFPFVVQLLNENQAFPTNSSFYQLNTFWDEKDGLLMVSSCLENSCLFISEI